MSLGPQTMLGTAPSGTPADLLAQAVCEHFTGPVYSTPDGLQAPFLQALERRGVVEYVVREDVAVGLAAGAALAGRTPVVSMQNSGLGQSVNALASLTVPYGLGMLLVVGMRGIDADDTEENTVMGRITPGLLESVGITVRVLGEQDVCEQISSAAEEVRAGHNTAVLIRPGHFGWSSSGS